MKIEDRQLVGAHVGATVVYTPKSEKGTIAAWNDTYIFVMFNGAAQACRSEDLRWYEGSEAEGYPHNQDKDLFIKRSNYEIRIAGEGEGIHTRLTIGVQSFNLAYEGETREQHEGYATSLAQALDRIAKKR